MNCNFMINDVGTYEFNQLSLLKNGAADHLNGKHFFLPHACFWDILIN